jgi:hypothetical protein
MEEKLKEEIIDDLLSNIEKDLQKKESTEIVKKDDKVDVEDPTSVKNAIVKTIEEDRALADKIVNTFLPEIAKGTDRSEASKEALTKALELKISAADKLVRLAELDVKSKEKSSGNVGIFIGKTVSPKKANIDIQKIIEEDE